MTKTIVSFTTDNCCDHWARDVKYSRFKISQQGGTMCVCVCVCVMKNVMMLALPPLLRNPCLRSELLGLSLWERRPSLLCVCVCLFVCMYVFESSVCVCVCVCERDKGRERNCECNEAGNVCDELYTLFSPQTCNELEQLCCAV